MYARANCIYLNSLNLFLGWRVSGSAAPLINALVTFCRRVPRLEKVTL